MATLIENGVRARRLPAGTFLGTKPELSARYGVGPEVFQQAARLLEQRGIAQMRRGKLGGLVVLGQKLEAVAHSLATYFEFANVPFGAFSAVHDPFAITMFGAIAKSLTLDAADDMRQRLRACLESDIGPWQGVFLSFDVRQEMVDLIGNPVLSLLHQTTMIFFVDMIPLEGITKPELADQLRFHLRNTAAFVDALIAHDVELAMRVSQENSDFGTSRLHVWEDAEDSISRVNRQKYDLGPQAEKWTGRRTLADKVARQMLRDIRLRGWPNGANLGTEAELLDLYGVSRATFRQAVRLLEHYSAAQMLRGPKGGLMVTSPDHDQLVETIVAYLGKGETRPHHVRPLQVELYLVAVDLLCEASSSQTLQLLGDCLAATSAMRGQSLREGVAKFFRNISEQSNNLVLQVYLSILDAFASSAQVSERIPDKRIQSVFSQTGSAFLQALATQDRIRARRAIFEYLKIESDWLDCGYP